MKKKTKTFSRLFNLKSLGVFETAQLKGGRRYAAANRKKVMAKKQALEAQGHTVCFAKHGDTYCIDW